MCSIDDVSIRPFREGDKALVSDFFDQMSGETRALFNRGDGNRKMAMRFFQGGGQDTIYFLAESGGCMVGYVFLWDMHTGLPWLGVAVHEQWKGRHLGRVLLHHAHEYARTLDKGGILLTTATANIRGQGLYERMGYERIGVHTSGELLYVFRFHKKES
jgi:ribosomal protein S18 acetylase RimI-like enzyme